MDKINMENTFESKEIKHTIERGIEFIQFKKLLKYPEIRHAYILKTNNMDFNVKKDFSKIEMVKKNLEKVSEIVGFSYENILRPDYNHTNNVEIVKIFEGDEKPSLRGENYKDTDGLITDKENVVLMSTNADCNLILIYDPIKKVIANVHAGWRGTFDKILKNAIVKMKLEYNCKPEDLICCFCPSIRKCHFEVDEDVAMQCKEIFEYTQSLDDIIIKGNIKDGKQKYYIDTVLINKILLKEEGVLFENIIDSDICSICNSDKIHSRRAEGIEFGLGTALIQILPE